MKIITQIAKVCSVLSQRGISKDHKNQQQGYKFRGIDDVYNALAPVIAEHGVVIVPSYSERTVAEHKTPKGSVLFYVTVKGAFKFCAEDGSSVEVSTYGEAMDSGDKATNKAMSAAYKYACFQTFCIPTEGDNDADAHSHEVLDTTKGEPVSRQREPLDDDIPMEWAPTKWQDHKVHYGKNKGKRLGDLDDKAVLFYHDAMKKLDAPSDLEKRLLAMCALALAEEKQPPKSKSLEASVHEELKALLQFEDISVEDFLLIGKKSKWFKSSTLEGIGEQEAKDLVDAFQSVVVPAFKLKNPF